GRRLHLVSGGAIFLAMTAPWFVAVSVKNPEFFDFFFIHEHFTRFLTGEHRREGAWWYFVPIFVVGILPWLAVFFGTVVGMWTGAASDENGFNWQRFALVWSAVIFIFFSASGSKLPSYVLPIFPALALPIGWQLTTLPDTMLARLRSRWSLSPARSRSLRSSATRRLPRILPTRDSRCRRSWPTAHGSRRVAGSLGGGSAGLCNHAAGRIRRTET